MAPSEFNAASLFASIWNTVTIYLKDLSGKRVTAFLCRMTPQGSGIKWNKLKAYCRKKHLRQFSGRLLPEGPRDLEQTKRLCFCHRAIPAEGWQAPETELELKQWNGVNETNFLHFFFPNTPVPSPFLVLTAKQESRPTYASVARKCWWQCRAEMSLWSMDTGGMGLNMGWPAWGRPAQGRAWREQPGTTVAPWHFVAICQAAGCKMGAYLYNAQPCTRAGCRLVSWPSQITQSSS